MPDCPVRVLNPCPLHMLIC